MEWADQSRQLYCRDATSDPNGSVDVLYMDTAAILKTNIDSRSNALVDNRGNANSTGCGERLQPRGNIDAVAVDVFAFDNYVTEIYTNSKHDGGSARFFIFLGGHRGLHLDSAVHGVNDAAEFRKRTVANQLYDPAVMLGYRRIEDIFAMSLQSR